MLYPSTILKCRDFDIQVADVCIVGNSAGVGAKMALVSRRERIRSQDIAARTRYLELTTRHNFNQRFARGMKFPEEKQVINSKK
jgi:uncharacterized 2Fe-2S/4Fe-4S cluster protein (DUF4445 family)